MAPVSCCWLRLARAYPLSSFTHGLFIRALDSSVIELVKFMDADRLVPPAGHLTANLGVLQFGP